MVSKFEMGSGAAITEGVEPNPNADTENAGTNDGADQAVIDERLKPVFNYFKAKGYTMEDHPESGVTVYTLSDAEGEPLAVGTLIELVGFVASDILKKGDGNENTESTEGDDPAKESETAPTA